jgi:hypothetical protein
MGGGKGVLSVPTRGDNEVKGEETERPRKRAFVGDLLETASPCGESRQEQGRRNNEDEGEQGEQTSERTADKKSESNVKENGEETNNVEVHIKGKVATVQDLFTRERKNIKVDGISYSSGIAIETRRNKKIIEYKKVYRCLMVLNKKTKRRGGVYWQGIETVQIKILLGVRGEWRASLQRIDIGFG